MFSNYLKNFFSPIKLKSSIFALLILTLFACKKDKGGDPAPEEEVIETPADKSPGTGSRDELTKDSIFLYARQVYLWWNKVPDYSTFKPREYSSLYSELFAITRFPVNSSTKLPYEYNEDDPTDTKYSYIFDINTKNPVVAWKPSTVASVDLESNGYDFGLYIGYSGLDTAYNVCIATVFPGSDAAEKGLERGDRLLKVNDISYGKNYYTEAANLENAIFNSSSVRLSVMKRSGETVNIALTRKSYKSSPIYKDSVYTSGNKKIGYLAYGRFSYASDTAKLNAVFERFRSAAVTDLIVDLRYNGGGYVSAAEHLINLIAPSTLRGSVMYTEHYNALMQQKKATILKNQPLNGSATYWDYDYSVKNNTYYFNKVGRVETIKNVVFIVSSRTASASELVINALKPHLNVKLVGRKTYGKPVGFFPIRIGSYDVYMSMFETRNSKDEGGYYDGMTVDSVVGDNFQDPFGDSNESCFKVAFNYLTKGSFIAAAKGQTTVLSKTVNVLQDDKGEPLMSGGNFNGMIENRIRIKK